MRICPTSCCFFFFFNDTATTEIYTLPYTTLFRSRGPCRRAPRTARRGADTSVPAWRRSEEHTSELQSQSNLVCRLLLEKKKKIGRHGLEAHVHRSNLCTTHACPTPLAAVLTALSP